MGFSAAAAVEFRCPRAILALGDSYTDTGELIQSYTGVEGFDAAERLPYGITYFRRPVDRNSDGRLIIDFLCKFVHLPTGGVNESATYVFYNVRVSTVTRIWGSESFTAQNRKNDKNCTV